MATTREVDERSAALEDLIFELDNVQEDLGDSLSNTLVISLIEVQDEARDQLISLFEEARLAYEEEACGSLAKRKGGKGWREN